MGWYRCFQYQSPSLTPTAAWSALLVLTGLKFRRERHDLSFVPPSSPSAMTYANLPDQHYGDKTVHPNATSDLETQAFRPRQEQQQQHEVYPVYEDPYGETADAGYGYTRAEDSRDARGRASVDAYGAFDGDGMPGPGAQGQGQGQGQAEEPSRTMQLAYTDPCKSGL
jgi:hypothetical protein